MILRYLLIFVLIRASFTCDDHIEQRRAPVKRPSSVPFNKLQLLQNLYSNSNPYSPYDPYSSLDAESRFLNPLSLLNPLSFLLASASCVSPSGLSGICTSSAQCSLTGGTASGSCGLGSICCISTITTCGSVTTRNNTYWQSPTTINANQPCALTVRLDATSLDQRKSPICQVRLDFQSFSIAQPDQTTSVCNAEYFQVTGASNGNAVICGDNNGQHMYLTAPSSTSDLTLNFVFDPSQTINRNWNIQIGFLPCGASYLAPSSCLQYFYGSTSGTIQSFNFKSLPPGNVIRQLGNQNYGICVRREKGFCAICYTQCTSTSTPPPFPFSISGNAGAPTAGTPPTPQATSAQAGAANCAADYLIIAGGYDPATPANVNDRFCGNGLNAQQGAMTVGTVCTTVKPFNLWYVTNAVEATDTPASTGNLGFCLNYKEQSC